jgi:phosphoserine phosphatase
MELVQMISKNTSPVNEFSPELWSQLESVLRGAARGGGKLVAAFDADGTLWDADAGETFFDWQIRNCDLPAFRGVDPWKRYHDLKNPDPRVAYVWLAQISAGRPLSEVRAWAAECFRSVGPWPVFESQRKLITLLRELKFDVYVVTASIKWAVEPVAALLGIDFDHVIGVETEVHNGIVTDIVKPPITWRDGKAEGLLARTGGVRPVLAAGNTVGDIALLQSATHVRLALSTQASAGGLYDEESKLADHASKEKWHIHPFRRR